MQYERPNSVTEAVGLLHQAGGNAFVLAGGTDLLVRMKGDDFEPDLVVDIKSIDGMGDISQTDDGFIIGAAVPCAALGEDTRLVATWPGVVEGANLIGSTQIQGRCTLAGNLCNASPAADSVPALVAADAQAVIAGKEGMRTIPVIEVPVAPGRTSLGPDEFITTIKLPPRRPRSSDAYLRFTPRTEMDIAVVGAAVSLEVSEDGLVQAARIALGAVAPTVVLVEEAADAMIGTSLDEATLDKVAAACTAACNPIDDKRGTVVFRQRVTGVLAKRAARIAYNRAGGN